MRTLSAFGLAHELAARLGHPEVTPVHFLLAVLREGRSPAVVTLYNRGVRSSELEKDLETLLDPPATPYKADYAWRESELGMLDKAAYEARELGHEYQGCEHILLAVLRESDSAPTKVLARHDLRFADAKAEVLRILGSPGNREECGP